MSYATLLETLLEQLRLDSVEDLLDKEYSQVEPSEDHKDRFKKYTRRSRGSVRLFYNRICTPSKFRRKVRTQIELP